MVWLAFEKGWFKAGGLRRSYRRGLRISCLGMTLLFRDRFFGCGGEVGVLVVVMMRGAERRKRLEWCFTCWKARGSEMFGSNAAFSQAPGARCADSLRVKALAACFTLRYCTCSKQQ